MPSTSDRRSTFTAPESRSRSARGAGAAVTGLDRAPQLLLPEHDRELVRLEQAPVAVGSLHPLPLPNQVVEDRPCRVSRDGIGHPRTFHNSAADADTYAAAESPATAARSLERLSATRIPSLRDSLPHPIVHGSGRRTTPQTGWVRPPYGRTTRYRCA